MGTRLSLVKLSWKETGSELRSCPQTLGTTVARRIFVNSFKLRDIRATVGLVRNMFYNYSCSRSMSLRLLPHAVCCT